MKQVEMTEQTCTPDTSSTKYGRYIGYVEWIVAPQAQAQAQARATRLQLVPQEADRA